MIILGSHEAAIDLLERRSANYSDRAPSPMAELYVPPAIALKVFEGLPYSSLIHSPKISSSDFYWALPVQGYGPWWRRHRRAFRQYFNPNAVKTYDAAQKLEAHRFVRRLIDAPEDFLHHIRQYVLLFPLTVLGCLLLCPFALLARRGRGVRCPTCTRRRVGRPVASCTYDHDLLFPTSPSNLCL